MKVLILWANPKGNANLGVSVLAEGAASIARRALGEDITITFQEFGSASDGPGLSRRMFLQDALTLGNGPIASRLRQFDVILDTGAGDSFTDHYGLPRLAQIVYAQRAAKKSAIPLVMMPQTIGPFNTRIGRLLGRVGSRAASSVFTRDPASLGAARALGVDTASGYTDVVFALPMPETGGSEYDVLLNVSGLLSEENNHVESSRYLSEVRALVNALLEKRRRVTLLAHVVGPEVNTERWGDNDVPVVRRLEREFEGRVDTAVPASLDEVRSMVSRANLVIGSRMHACLNALSVGTPAIALAYSRKFAPLMEDLGWPYCIDLREDDSPCESLLRMIETSPESVMRAQVATVRSTAEKRTLRMVNTLKELADV